MAEITLTPRANDIKLSKDLYIEANNKNLTISALLEEMDPSESNDKLDAFERQLKRFGIVTKDDPEHGVFASTGQLFFQSNVPESRVLFPEFIERSIRAAMMDETDYLAYLVNGWTTSNAGIFRALYVDDTATTRKSGRRGEGARVAKMKVTWSEKTVNMNDFGIEIDMSYEFTKWASLPMIQTILKRAAMQRRYDEAGEALTTIISGDGGSKESTAAANTNLSDLGVATPEGTEELTYVAWLKWAASFAPYVLTTLIGTVDDIIEWFTMAKPSTDPAVMYQLLDKSQTGGVPTLVNLGVSQVAAVCHSDSSASVLVGIDKRFALHGYRDMGMDMVETDRVIDAKFDKIVISNKVGFANIFAAARKKLTTSA